MLKEIGSNFWLDRYQDKEKNVINMDYLGLDYTDIAFLSTGRSAISFVLEHLRKQEVRKTALLPSFTCHSVIEPFINAGYQIHFYGIDKKLEIDTGGIIADVIKHKPAVILVHSYFGFNTVEALRDSVPEIRRSGIAVIEDVTQSLYSSFNHLEADFYIGSLRKWTALPDGGFAISKETPFLYKPKTIDEQLQEMMLTAFHAKHLYIEKGEGNKNWFLEKFKEAEGILDQQKRIFAMSPVSITQQANLDINHMINRRKENYKKLAKGLINIPFLEPLFKDLTKETTPLYFPVYIEKGRSTFQGYLAGKGVYAPIIWPRPEMCEGKMCSDAEWIYEHIVSIPCDQRYGGEEMDYIIETIKGYK